jgi:hypothetical protein
MGCFISEDVYEGDGDNSVKESKLVDLIIV